MKNKRGIIGDFSVMFIAIILIVMILTIFTLVSVAVKVFSDNSSSVSAVKSESEVGLVGVKNYFSGFPDVVEKRRECFDNPQQINSIAGDLG